MQTVCEQNGNFVFEMFAGILQTVGKLLTKFAVQTLVAVSVSKESAAAASEFYITTHSLKCKGKVKRRLWRESFERKEHLLLVELKVDGMGFSNFLGMSKPEFKILIQIVARKISRKEN